MATNLWQISGLVLSVAQAAFHYASLQKYVSRLEDLADDVTGYADAERIHYEEFREADPDFYAYYQGLPGYNVCDSNILRSKGKPFAKYGNDVRRMKRLTRGFAPLGNVHHANQVVKEIVSESAVQRAVTAVAENARVDDHVLERWSAIVSAPVGQERYSNTFYSSIINQSFESLKAHGRGFNSAGVSVGNYLYQILN